MPDYKWEIIGSIGIFCAAIYKIPQIIKIIKTKKGSDLSNKMFILHLLAYIFLLAYQFGTYVDSILIAYYIIGMIQTFILIFLKYYYKKRDVVDNELS
jgi:uncharacterized protein with PQ loop repeat